MTESSRPQFLPPFPPDLIQAVAHDAKADAGRVAQFLSGLGLQRGGDGVARVPLRLPAYFLVGLAAALRLFSWEQGGLRIHRDAGLPSAAEALQLVARSITTHEPVARKEQASRQLLCQILTVFVERLAWNGRALLEADLELGEADEETLVDALADLLWAHRHDTEGPALAG